MAVSSACALLSESTYLLICSLKETVSVIFDYICLLEFVILVLILESWFKGSIVPSVRSLVLDEERMATG